MKKNSQQGDKAVEQQKVDVNFESHPPIDEDLDGVTSLTRQTFLNFVDCHVLAKHLIELKEITQVIALECDEEEEENQSDEDEPDNDIYGVISRIELKNKKLQTSSNDADELDKLNKFLLDKCQRLKQLLEEAEKTLRVAVIVNERYINLPPQLSVPTLKNLTTHLKDFTHLVFVSKVQLKARQSDTNLPSKKSKHSATSAKEAEPIIYTNPEEEIIFENCEFHSDVDVSAYCDENATWSATSDIKYIPHRRIMVVDSKKWPGILESLCKELEC